MFLFLFQSCSIYHSGDLSVEEAVATEDKIEVITEDEEKYKFVRLQKEDDKLLGITKRNSKKYRKLADKPSVL